MLTENLVEHDPGPFDESQQDAAEDSRARSRAQALAHLEEAARGGAGYDGVPRVLLLADVDHGAVEGGEQAPPDGEAPADSRRVHAHGLGAADEPSPLWGVVEALNEVESRAADCAHAERAADIVEDTIWARLPRSLWSSHGRKICGRAPGLVLGFLGLGVFDGAGCSDR